MNEKTPQLADVILAALGNTTSNLRVMLPGRIESYDSGTRRASIQLLIQDQRENEAGRRVPTTIPVLTDVPVAFVGWDAERIKLPVSRGDECMVVFASSSIATWKSTGGLVDPADPRHHHVADAIALLGIRARRAGDLTCIDISDAALKLGSSTAVEPALLGNAFLSQLGTLVQAIATAVSGIPTGGAAAGAAITAALTSFQSAVLSYTSQKVKLV